MTINRKNSINLLAGLLSLGLFCYLVYEICSDNTAVFIKSQEPSKEVASATPEEQTAPSPYPIMGESVPGTSPKKGKGKPQVSLKFKAVQVIDLSGSFKEIQANTYGTIVRVKLLNDVDTREPGQICRVSVLESGIAELPAKTLLFGKAGLGGSKRVLMKFDRALLPSGEEANLSAQAIDSKNNKAGVEGNFHGRNGVRALGSMSLNMISGMSETLTQKESLGGFQGQVANRPTLKNAIFSGIAKTSEEEAIKQSENLNSLPEYAELKQGTVFAIQLLEKVQIER